MLAPRVRQSLNGTGPTTFTLVNDASATKTRTIASAYGYGAYGVFTIVDSSGLWSTVEGYATDPDGFTVVRTIRNSLGNANNVTFPVGTKTIFPGEYADALALLVQCPTTTGTATAYAVAYTPAPLAVIRDATIKFIPHVTNTGAATLSINGLAPVPLQRANGSPLLPGDLMNGQAIEVVLYGATAARLLRPSFRGAMVRRTVPAGSIFVNGVDSVAVFDGVPSYDTDGFWNGTNALFVPSGFGPTRVRFHAQISLDAASTAVGQLIIRSYGSSVVEARQTSPIGSATYCASTPWMMMLDGDYAEVRLQQYTGANRDFGTSYSLHWFAMEVAP